MALGLEPSNLPRTLQLLAVLSDELWYHAGDTSTDTRWYSRRAGLLALYSSAGA